MWLISFEAFPDPKTNPEQFAEYGGAFVNCWIDFEDENGAVELAKFYIKDSNWKPKRKPDTVSWYSRKTQLRKKHNVRCFTDAKKYGYVLCFYTYPIKDKTDRDD